MGFNEVKCRLITALQNGTFQHEARATINTKNLLSTGQVAAADICELVKRCNGTHHSQSPHHSVSQIEVHILRRDGWYIKFYFVDSDTIFISVHL